MRWRIMIACLLTFTAEDQSMAGREPSVPAGVRAEPKKTGFIGTYVRPLFPQSIWFRASGVCVLVGAAGVVVWWYSHRKHSRHLVALERAREQRVELARVGRVSLLGELSASLAHELNQPLAAILSNAQAALRFLNNDPVDLEEVRASLKDIAAADRRASEIIGRMREMMKKGEAQMEPRDLNADLEQVLLLLRSDLIARHTAVAAELAAGLPLVRGDHIQLQQVLLNLIINGCDAMAETPPDERRLVVSTVRDGDEMIRVSVADHGTGVALETVEKIFDPFYTTKANGLGMGLSICRAIVKAHGGELWVSNNAERGATFQFTLRTEKTA